MKYERLTERRETPLVMSQWGGTSKELKIYNRLAELEDKIERGELVENTVVTYVNMGRCNSKTLIDKALKFDELKAKLENGTLIELPCKVGDTIWFIRATDREIIEAVVTRIVFNTELSNTELSFEVADKYCDYIVFAKGIFLTKAEAEAKLKELKGEV